MEVIPVSFSATHAGKLIGGTSENTLIIIDPIAMTQSMLLQLPNIGSDIVFSETGVLYGVAYEHLYKVDASLSLTNLSTTFSGADGIAIDDNGQRLFIADSGQNSLYSYDLGTGNLSNLGSYNFDGGWYSTGILWGTNGVLLLTIDGTNETLSTITP